MAKALFVKARMGVVFWQHTFERGIVTLDGEHGVIDGFADGRLLRAGFEERPARLLRNPEDVDGAVLVWVFRVGPFVAVRVERGMLFFERVGNVLKKNQAQHDVLVLGSVNVGAERIGGLPQFPLESESGSVVVIDHISSPLH